MLSRWNTLLALISLTGIGLLSYELLAAEPTLPALVGLSLVALTTFAYTLSLRHMRVNAFQSAMSNYAERQIHHESLSAKPAFDAPSTAL